ncbi:hypothetical protein SAMN04488063_0976 [Halopelagius inordinatus]|uniref:Uncharacterized protein n=1 Tax=Halopelagius inordinatus TaxID=553467 RepID=A0A1I2N075_9EURY|nr:hypothetical protein SAMN04488063_0976 [Halopelagius inordinatus]
MTHGVKTSLAACVRPSASSDALGATLGVGVASLSESPPWAVLLVGAERSRLPDIGPGMLTLYYL